MRSEPNGQPKVADELAGHLRPVGELILLPGNPRQGDIGAISLSLRRFGQLKPIVVNSDGVILAGNHTYQAALALGWDQVAAITVDLEGQDQTAFALADNRLSDLASYDVASLLDMIGNLTDLDGTGYDSSDIDQMLADLNDPGLPNPNPLPEPELDGRVLVSLYIDRELFDGLWDELEGYQSRNGVEVRVTL